MKHITKEKLHTPPKDFKDMLKNSPEANETWQDITPLARNEWICWVISVKKAETRTRHITRAKEELAKGKRRPCCWPECPHR